MDRRAIDENGMRRIAKLLFQEAAAMTTPFNKDLHKMELLFARSENSTNPHEALIARRKLVELLDKHDMELFDISYMVCPKDQVKWCIDCMSYHDHELCIICLETDMREKPLWEPGPPTPPEEEEKGVSYPY